MVGQAGGAGGSGPAKRGRPAVNASNNNADAPGVAGVGAQPTLGPSIQVHSGFAEQNHKRLVLALQSGLKGELTWALNTLTMLSFKEKDDSRKDSTPLAKIPGLLDAVLHVINEWRDIGHNRESAKLARPRTLGAGRPYTGFGAEYDISSSADPLNRLRTLSESWTQDESKSDGEGQKKASDWWWDEEGLFNLDELGRAERQQCAVAASNVIRNFSFMPENEQTMAQNRHCLETLVVCMEDHETEDDELVTNALESIVNLAPFLLLKIFGETIDSPARGRITVKRVVQVILGMLESQVRAWHCSAAELLGRLVVNPDNEPFILSFAPQIYRRLVDLLGLPVSDAQAAAVAALYNFAEINMDCRLRLANERWAVGRLLRVVQAPHPLAEICRKAALTLESLASEPQNRAVLMSHENSFVEIAMTDMRMSDIFARILFEMSSGTNSRVAPVRGVWGS
ncbi:hypothetical protein MPTK1_8g09650 [Marchantia polymorpha subsp. ruderalis]|uniref:SWI/SNF-like complex subunit BAF250 C-terminal domain-containing protein n=2 Tax=Marchantia polymorpha TaxID=3197 RepID=A0A176WDY0_MARPO|nr:hypothetical protein AXG93_4510s1010 [Marchantia polymorpha subsp. ruderalis]PTQ47511.1 hypothetical protein MARPO_0008s0256 [Marchantia polymorpha]PTQ47514.1 hypothetical protein MARPO_0008s0256 [Marchantia polymorpha]BBN19319.1 hypothetical protein Mp_8g09650 [Marchantia polymorpha subsp. ruderalis]BBN19320.1 hypothetical protein Mp_8g09650 [Marchantia polymorpha subsp. ruderalis]|eukprot:PTQ47511.1 hypothetical protein MARPO_0008s0256 [Marchantia polymorpha]